ncbi:hemolysin family protein [Kineosporia succinea]|uniref:CBS domain containing-hemolysin-like protein n=1 Tax=Kineosporia succinea TaxID=84632 RepID=A0ABT9P451_9ACTN|nr:hemolysin family protein [Kineosporia succinea]MDP9827457.1 CBS domain containing-hemolysin-like protein [Kineosporia succinea]
MTSLLVALLLLALNSFFVGAEFAVISARRSQIEPLADAGSRAAKTAMRAMEQVSLMLACCQLGITIASLGLGLVAEPAIAHLIEAPAEAAHLPEGLIHPLAFAIALAVVSYLHVVLGEMVPKNLALAGPDRAVLLLAPPLMAVARATSPVIRLLNWFANHAVRLLRVEPKDEVASTFTADEVASIVSESTREGLLDDHGLLTGALEFSELSAGDLMIPVGRLVTVPAGSTPAEVERLVTRTGFSRFPVVRSSGAPEIEVLGYLHLKDLLYADDERHAQPIPEKRVRSLVSVSTQDEVEEALATMQRAGSHLARVVDHDGRTLGVLFLEDVLEELVGEVRDATRRAPARA